MATDSAIVVFADGKPTDVLRAYPVLDKPATRALAERLFPGAELEEVGDQLLADVLSPPEHVAYVGCFPGLDLVCSWTIMPDRPSLLDPALLTATERPNAYLHAVHGDAGWCAFGVWQNGVLVRACSAGPDDGLLEDLGERLGFERDFWDDGRLTEAPYALGQAALHGLFGIGLPADGHLDDVDPELIPVVGYRVTTRDESLAAVPEPRVGDAAAVTLETASTDGAR
jgi:hypothetical protein